MEQRERSVQGCAPGQGSEAARWARLLACVFGAMVLGACSHHMRLVMPETTGGARYVCSGLGACEPATIIDPARANDARTSFVALPSACRGRVHELLIRDVRSSDPKVEVTCAPTESDQGPRLEEME